jgi:hypothetical protein
VCETIVPVVPPTARPIDVHIMMPRYLRSRDGAALGFGFDVDAFLIWRMGRRLRVKLFRRLFIVCVYCNEMSAFGRKHLDPSCVHSSCMGYDPGL